MARSPRLTPQRWIDAGLDALQQSGVSALAAEPLARNLKTTKGSFYWHFADVPAFHAALQEHWQDQAIAEVTQAAQDTTQPADCLRRFAHDLMRPGPEAALRAWALHSPDTADAIAPVDAARLALLNHLLRRLGLPNPAFAKALLASVTSLPQIAGTDADAACDALIDTILALQ